MARPADRDQQRSVGTAAPSPARPHFRRARNSHDYTGRHGDIWTDGQGRATFTVPSNAFGSGQSYLCFSRTGQDKAPDPPAHRTVQSFFGAPDLDIGRAQTARR